MIDTVGIQIIIGATELFWALTHYTGHLLILLQVYEVTHYLYFADEETEA